MGKLTTILREKLPTDVCTDTEIANLVAGTADRRYSLVKRALASGELLQLRRGVYALGKRFQQAPLNQLELAQKIYAPSYISLESALAQHGWIPEGVYTITSACMKRSNMFETPLGNFSYTRIPKFNFIGVDRITEGKSVYLLATPTKALADYIIANKIEASPKALRESLRIEDASWRQLSFQLLSEITESYRSIRLRKFIKAAIKDMVL